MRKKYIDYVKFLAVLFVLNSHLDSIYPVSSIAIGGGIGNTLFFLVSGYTWAEIRDRGYFEWYRTKAKRVFIPTIITNVLYIIIYENISTLGVIDIFKLFVFPNKSWFCGAILIYALVYYWCAKKRFIIPYIASVSILLYAVWYILFIDKSSFVIESLYDGSVCRFCFYFLCMMAGLILRDHEKLVPEKPNQGQGMTMHYLIIAIVCFLISYGFKPIMNHYSKLMVLQFICQILNLICAICIFVFLQNNEKKIKTCKADNAITVVSLYSWEIYLTQTLIIPLCVAILFPFNLLLVLLGTAIASYILKRICKILIR